MTDPLQEQMARLREYPTLFARPLEVITELERRLEVAKKSTLLAARWFHLSISDHTTPPNAKDLESMAETMKEALTIFNGE